MKTSLDRSSAESASVVSCASTGGRLHDPGDRVSGQDEDDWLVIKYGQATHEAFVHVTFDPVDE